MRPSVGRIVHYRDNDPKTGEPVCRAAIVTALRDDIENGVVDLHVFQPMRIDQPVEQHWVVYLGERDGNWHWPERMQ